MANNTKDYTAISVFSGMGGLDLGFKQKGFEILAYIDKNPLACNTIKNNIPENQADRVFCDDIKNITGQELLDKIKLLKGEIDVLIGGAPCQSFSKTREVNRKGIKDARGRLYIEFARLLSEIQPECFVFENVRGLVSANKGEALKMILTEFQRKGYKTRHNVLNAADYGVPQKRERLIILGSRNGHKPPYFPSKTHGIGRKKPYVTSFDAIGDLVEFQNEDNVCDHVRDLLREIPPGDNYLFYTEKRGYPNPRFKWRSRHWNCLLKLSPNKPANVIQAKPGTYVGPFHWNNRRLTILELKRLFSIPDNYRLPDNYRGAHELIGNSVPVLFGKHLAAYVKYYLRKIKS
ncbi:MAG: DNA cytosine methyltransferase [Candidatus Hodarchaeales archaeon]|jgi:DNA (cytosine-5)-methyltransferase 1